jgi:hypothetical protein
MKQTDEGLEFKPAEVLKKDCTDCEKKFPKQFLTKVYD